MPAASSPGEGTRGSAKTSKKKEVIAAVAGDFKRDGMIPGGDGVT
jgi:hypothetical protein